MYLLVNQLQDLVSDEENNFFCFGQTALGTPQISLGAPSLGIFLWDTRPEWELHSLLFAVL